MRGAFNKDLNTRTLLYLVLYSLLVITEEPADNRINFRSASSLLLYLPIYRSYIRAQLIEKIFGDAIHTTLLAMPHVGKYGNNV
jgi:hypothetical protein